MEYGGHSFNLIFITVIICLIFPNVIKLIKYILYDKTITGIIEIHGFPGKLGSKIFVQYIYKNNVYMTRLNPLKLRRKPLRDGDFIKIKVNPINPNKILVNPMLFVYISCIILGMFILFFPELGVNII